MAKLTSIEWTNMTWNPVTGCTKISQGCKNCYAERMARRLLAMGSPRYPNGFEVTLHHDLIQLPFRWKHPRVVFVNSMSDLFHDGVPDDFIARVFRTMADCPRHTFQVLTKRSDRLRRLAPQLPLTPNIWIGVSVEDEEVLHRVDDLRAVPAHVRFLACEPLIGSLRHLDLDQIHWVIVGGESGPRARPMEEPWVWEIQGKCEERGIPFFFKQWGGVRKHLHGRQLGGREYNQFPVSVHMAPHVG